MPAAPHAAPSAVRRMIDEQIVARGVHDARTLDALAAVPREAFVPADLRKRAFDDAALPIGHGQTISQPYIVALMTAALNVCPTDRVLEIGTGSGYQTAVLAKLAAEVCSVERVKPLLDEAFERLAALGLRNVRLRHADGSVGWPERGPFDRILVAAAAPDVPHQLTDQLIEGGVVVIPTGNRDQQKLLTLTKRKGVLVPQVLCDCRFVPLVGQAGWAE